MAHAGAKSCHWCQIVFPWSHAMRRHDHRSARRNLPPFHPMRRAGVWGKAEDRGPPEPRTHASIIRDAATTEAAWQLKWKDKQHPRRDTGVDGECPLAKVPLFNLVWDVCMDYMHLVKVLISGHLLPLLKSQRTLKPPQLKANLGRDREVSRYTHLAPQYVRRYSYNRLYPVVTGYFRL